MATSLRKEDLIVGNLYCTIGKAVVQFHGWSSVGHAIFEHYEDRQAMKGKVYTTELWADYTKKPKSHVKYLYWVKDNISGDINCFVFGIKGLKLHNNFTILKVEEVTYTEGG